MSDGAARVAFLSDVHSNLEALQAVLSDFGTGRLYCLGDIVGYGASPNEVVRVLKERRAICVTGNHDQAAVTGDASGFSRLARIAAIWTASRLDTDTREFLAGLPKERTEEIAGKRVYMAHGSPDDNLWEYVYESSHRELFHFYLRRLSVDAIALGHTHEPFVWTEKGEVVFNPGSVGQPRTGDRRASYAVLTVQAGEISVSQRGVEYDVEGSARRIKDAGLPPELADRLFVGE